jgi:hypothetical protein
VVPASLIDLIDLVDIVDSVNLGQVPPLTTLLVWTWNSLYKVVVTRGSHCYVQGGAFFPNPTPAYMDGASEGGGWLRMGWIGVGFEMEFRVGERHFMTSPVVAIAAERPGTPIVH